MVDTLSHAPGESLILCVRFSYVVFSASSILKFASYPLGLLDGEMCWKLQGESGPNPVLAT